MRLLIFTTLIVCVFSIGLFLYLERDDKQFIEKIQTPASEGTSTEKVPTTEDADTFSTEETPRVDAQVPQSNIDIQVVDTDAHQVDPLYPDRHAASENSDLDSTENVSVKDSESESNLKKEPPAPFETLKKKLIETHGDIPLVHTYIALRKKQLNRETMTMDEVSTLWEAIMIFNPTPENRKTYELIKHLSSQAEPGSFKMYYDPEGAKRRAETQ